MQKTETGMNEQHTSAQEAKPQLTPHQLYNYHIQHPNEPITDEDIRNLKIDSGGVFEDHQVRDSEPVVSTTDEQENKSDTTEEKNTDSERPIESTYDILGG